jgi:hypothetical protein
MKFFLLLTLFFTHQSINQAFAKTTLNEEMVRDLKSKNILDKLRVYVNKRVVYRYTKSSLNQDTVVSGEYRRAEKVDINKIVLRKSVRGKVLSTDSNHYTLYVSFDAACTDIVSKCHYEFKLADKTKDYQKSKFRFYLVSYPTRVGFNQAVSAAKKVFLTFNKKELQQITKTTEKVPGFKD